MDCKYFLEQPVIFPHTGAYSTIDVNDLNSNGAHRTGARNGVHRTSARNGAHRTAARNGPPERRNISPIQKLKFKS